MSEIVNDGTWPPIMRWLDSLAHEGVFRIPFGTRPPIRRCPDGTLTVDTKDGTRECKVGERVAWDEVGLFFEVIR